GLLRSSAAVVAALLAVAVLVAAHPRPAAAATTSTASYRTPGTTTWTVPNGVNAAVVDVYGAAGGAYVDGSGSQRGAAAGGHVRATLFLTPGDRYTLTVGGLGGSVDVRTSSPGTSGGGGYKGGGSRGGSAGPHG